MANKLDIAAGRGPVNPPLKPKMPLCPICRGQGFTGCPEAIAPSDHPVYPGGTFMAVALARGVACSCPAGAEFAGWQMGWNR